MFIPVGRGGLYGLTDLLPALKPPPLERQRAQDLPPRLDQIEVRSVLGLKDKLPPRMGQTEQQDIRGAMRTAVIPNSLHPRDGGGQPRVHSLQEINPVAKSSSRIGGDKGLARGGVQGPEEIPFAPPPIIKLWLGPRCRGRGLAGGCGRRCRPQLLAGKTLGRFWPHLIQAHHYATRRRRGVEFRNGPLFLAHAGSTRSPNPLSCVRQRSPSRRSKSSMWLRLILMPFSSWRYDSRRSSVHEAKGNPTFWGLERV